jgi:hypothetical protein
MLPLVFVLVTVGVSVRLQNRHFQDESGLMARVFLRDWDELENSGQLIFTHHFRSTRLGNLAKQNLQPVAVLLLLNDQS